MSAFDFDLILAQHEDIMKSPADEDVVEAVDPDGEPAFQFITDAEYDAAGEPAADDLPEADGAPADETSDNEFEAAQAAQAEYDELTETSEDATAEDEPSEAETSEAEAAFAEQEELALEAEVSEAAAVGQANEAAALEAVADAGTTADADIEADTEAEAAGETVEFSIPGHVLSAALKEVKDAFRSSGLNNVYVAAVNDGDLLVQNSMAPAAGQGRLVVGAMGDGRDYYFVDVPCAVKTQGRFLINEAGKLEAFAKLVGKGTLNLRHYVEHEFAHFIELSEPGRSHHVLDIKLPYATSEIDDFFQATRDRFDTPTKAMTNETVAAMLARAEKLRAGIKDEGSRAGDVIWGKESIKFEALIGQGEHTLAPSLTVPFKGDDEFEWEIEPTTLKTLSQLFATEGTLYAVDSDGVDDDGEPTSKVLQVAFARPLTDTDFLIAHRQMEIRRNSEPVRQWLGTGGEKALFESADCKLWATLKTAQVFHEAEKTWTLASAAPLTLSRTVFREEEGPRPGVLLLGAGVDDPQRGGVDATHGDSAVQQLYFHPDIKGALKAIVDGHEFFQILSYPAKGEESEAAMVLVPMPDGAAVTAKPTDPASFMIVAWQP